MRRQLPLRLFPGLLALAALCTPASVSAGAAYSFYGTNTGGKTFNRPNVDSVTLTGKIVPYSSQPFFVDSTGTCRIQSVQNGSFDGVIYLYRGVFDPAAPLTNLVAASDNSAGGPTFSEIPAVQLLANQNFYLVTAGGEPGSNGTFSNFVFCTGASRILAGDGTLPSTDGRYGELRNGRFRVSGTWKNFQGQSGNATFVPLGSDETGVLWFFSPSNFEVMIKVVDGCGINNRYWVFFAALTNVEYKLTVLDTWSETQKVYENALGVSAPTVTDTTTFQVCP